MAIYATWNNKGGVGKSYLTFQIASEEGVPNSVAGWDGGLSSYYATFSL